MFVTVDCLPVLHLSLLTWLRKYFSHVPIFGDSQVTGLWASTEWPFVKMWTEQRLEWTTCCTLPEKVPDLPSW